MKIKKLVWNKDYLWHTSQTEVGNYKLGALSNSYCMDLLRGDKVKNLGILFKTEKEAKEAAQKDFEKRVKRCIDPG